MMNATFNGNLVISGNTTFGSASGDDVTFLGSIAATIPVKTHNSFNFGSSTSALASYYVAAGATNTCRIMAGSAGSSWTLTLPTGPGTNGFVPQTNGSGTLTFVPGHTAVNDVSSANYDVTDTDGYAIIRHTTGNSDRTTALPTAASTNSGRTVRVMKVDTGTGKVTANTTTILRDIGDWVDFYSNGTAWAVIGLGGTLYSSVRVDTASGHGSTDTMIREFTGTAETIGQAITHATSATNGSTFTISRDGIYSISYMDYRTTGDTTIGISKNSNQLTTSIASITAAHNIAMHPFDSDTGASGGALPWTGKLVAGDIIRAHTNGNTDGTTAATVKFVITQIQKL
jgi:hypothetical protein